MDFCIYAKEGVDVLSEGVVCYIDDYPEVNDNDEEEDSDFVKERNLNYYCEKDCFLEFQDIK